MANPNFAFGFAPVGEFSGGLETGINEYTCDASTAAMYRNDPLVLAAGGKVSPAAANSTNIVGSFVGVRYELDGRIEEPKYWPGNVTGAKNIVVLVADDPNQKFKVQTDIGGAPFEEADLGKNANILVGTGDTDTGVSKAQLDISTAGTEATKQFRIVKVSKEPSPDQNEVGNYTVVEGFWNLHAYRNNGGV